MEKKPKGKIGWIIALCAIVAVAVAAVAVGAALLTPIAGKLYPRSVTSLDLHGATVTSVAGIERLNGLTSAELTGCGLTVEMYEQLKTAFPDCDIHWDVPLGDAVYDSRSESLVLPALAAEDAPRLLLFPDLTAVDATGSTCYDELLSVQQALPQLQLTYTVTIGGRTVTSTDASVDLSDTTVDADAVSHALSRLPALSTLDVRGSTLSNDDVLALMADYPDVDFLWSYRLSDGKSVDMTSDALDLTTVSAADRDAVDALLSHTEKGAAVDLRGSGLTPEDGARLSAAYPDLTLYYTVTLGSLSCDNAAASLSLCGAGATAAELKEKLKYFPLLTEVDLLDSGLSETEARSVADAYPDVFFRFRITVCGVETDTSATFLNLSNKQLGSTAEVAAAMPYLRRMTQMDMCRCGIENEDMAALQRQFPACKFVWMVKIGRYLLRTDVNAYGTMNNPSLSAHRRLTSEDLEPLKYCTDIVALDVARNTLRDLSFLQYVPDLEILILGDNYITDISDIARCKKLTYIELYRNDVTDVTPLLELKDLTYLSITSNDVQNPELFAQMTKLKRLWLKGNVIPADTLKLLKASLPDCAVNLEDSEWRDYQDPVYKWMRGYFTVYLYPDKNTVFPVGY